MSPKNDYEERLPLPLPDETTPVDAHGYKVSHVHPMEEKELMLVLKL